MNYCLDIRQYLLRKLCHKRLTMLIVKVEQETHFLSILELFSYCQVYILLFIVVVLCRVHSL